VSETGTFLSWANFVDPCFILFIDGIGHAFITRPEVEEVQVAWQDATPPAFELWNFHGGLVIQGSIERQIEPFDASIEPGGMRFSILDYENALTPIMFGEGRTDILRSALAEDMTPASASFVVADLTKFTLESQVWIGLECMNVITDMGSNEWAVERGYWSVFPAADTLTWQGTHEIDMNGDAPDVTSIPTNWYNRRVALYVCHKVGTTWSAGFPHNHLPNDAELLWAGVIKHYTDAGDGFIHIDCEEITSLLRTSVGTRVYEGTLDEGVYIEEADCEFAILARFTLTQIVGGVESFVESWPAARYLDTLSDLHDTTVSHDEAKDAINDELTTALTGGNDGLHAPTGATCEVTLNAEGYYQIVLTWDDAPPSTATDWLKGEPEIWASPFVWKLLGFNTQSDSFRPAESHDGWVRRVRLERDGASASTWRIVAAEQPMRFLMRVDDVAIGQKLTVVPTTDLEFTPQAVMPSGFGTAEGFLALNDGKIVAFDQVTGGGDDFIIRGLLGADWKRVRHGANVRSGNNELGEFLYAYDDGGDAIKARQVWVEPFDEIGVAMLNLILSTGSPAYNTVYDRLPLGFGCAFPSSLIDIDSFLAMPAIPYKLVIEKSKPASQLIESALNSTGRHLVWKSGKLTVVNPLADPEADPVVLDESNKVQLFEGNEPEFLPTPIERNPSTIINRAVLRHSPRPDGSFAYAEPWHGRRSQSEYGQAKSVVLDGWGIFQEGATYWTVNVASAIFLYFSRPVAMGTRPINFNVAAQIHPGLTVALTDPFVVDPRTGRRGVAELAVWVLGFTFDWMTGIGEVRICFAPHALRSFPEEE
jgi:hypothetical protein